MARLFAVWCLVLALPIYGLSGALVHLLGAGHFHRLSMPQTAFDVSLHLDDFRRHGDAATVAAAPAHSHSVLKRHHHGADDATVVSIGGRDDGDSTGDGAAYAGSACQVMAPCCATGLPHPSHRRVAWRLEPAPVVAGLDPDRLDRPPKA